MDRDYERPRTFTVEDVKRAHAAAVDDLYRLGYAILPASLDVLTQLRRAHVSIDRESLFTAAAELALPLADAPTERGRRFRRVY